MITTLTYNFTVGKATESLHLVESSDGRNAIAALDVSDYDGTRFDIENVRSLISNKYAKVSSRSIVGTVIESNTDDILITDVISPSGDALYYKGLIRFKGATSILIDGVKVDTNDDKFFYTNDRGTVTYVFENRSIEIEEEFYPVYINGHDHQLDEIMSMDDKYYSAIRDGELFSITVASSDVYVSVKNDSWLSVKEYNKRKPKELNLYIKPYFCGVPDIYQGYDSLLIYEAEQPSVSIIDVSMGMCSVYGDYIYLPHEYIYSSDIVLYMVDPKDITIKKQVEISKFGNSVFLKSGKVYAPELSRTVSENGYKIAADYRYAIYEQNNISIPIVNPSEVDYISVCITPTRIRRDKADSINLSNDIKYFVINKFGSIIESNVKVDYTDYVTYFNIIGGEVFEIPLTTKPEISQYKDIFSIYGLSEIAKVRIKKIPTKAVANNRLSIPKQDSSGLRQVRDISNSINVLKYMGDKNLFLNAGVTSIPTDISTNASIAKYISGPIKTVLKIDYSRDINEVNYTEVSDSEILSFAKDMSKFSKTDKTKYKVYGIYNSEVTEFDMSGAVYPEDEDAIYLAMDNSTLLMHDAIGVSYGSNLPKRYIKI